MSFLKATKPVLGMNARNLHYISRYNTSSDKRFADNKLFTKQFLGSRKIGVARLYHQVKSYKQLTPEFFESLPASFVMKPNKGFGGGGITVIDGRSASKKYYITPSGKRRTQEQLFQQGIEILEGKYSISGVGDSIVFEERLVAHSDFRQLTKVGLPDVRMIMFNSVPVLAMLRVPTEESEGKANMELGAIALGIDIGSGRTTGGAYYSQYITRLPNGQPARDFVVPFWDEILLTCARIQRATGIGFLGVDLVITPDGVKVLELNARSGLKIQIANKAGLRARLEKVKDLRVRSAEEAVEIAKTLFGVRSAKKSENNAPTRPVIGPVDTARLNGDEPMNLKVKVDLAATQNVMDVDGFEDSIADITLGEKRVKIPVQIGNVKGADLLLCPTALTEFYVDPSKPYVRPRRQDVSAQDEAMIVSFDERLAQVAEQIKLLSHINPRNVSEQKALFLSHADFDPVFSYREKDFNTAPLRRDLTRLPEVQHPLYPLFDRRRKELLATLTLIESVQSDGFAEASEAVFGGVSKRQYEAARAFIRAEQKNFVPDESEVLSLGEASTVIEVFLKQQKLSHWSLKVLAETAVDIQVTKNNKILLREGATFKRNRLQSLLAHEVGAHVFRTENGRRQPYRIFEYGTADYLTTEEGLAIWNQNQLGLNLGEKVFGPALHMVTIYAAKTRSFREVFTHLVEEYGLAPERAWHHCLKAKRGLPNGNRQGAFTKDTVYWRGLQQVNLYAKRHTDLTPLYSGKVSVRAWNTLKNLETLVAPKFVFDPTSVVGEG